MDSVLADKDIKSIYSLINVYLVCFYYFFYLKKGTLQGSPLVLLRHTCIRSGNNSNNNAMLKHLCV